MIDAILKDLDQKPALIKAAPRASRSRAFALWLALLVLYVLLLPSAAETTATGAGISTSDAPALGFVDVQRHDAVDVRR
jgi:hypothetical protein